MTDRVPCPCRCQCPCKSHEGLCWSCRQGIHSSGERMREHFAAGVEAWLRIVPVSLGSSGISDKQRAQAEERWRAWHADTGCEARP